MFYKCDYGYYGWVVDIYWKEILNEYFITYSEYQRKSRNFKIDEIVCVDRAKGN